MRLLACLLVLGLASSAEALSKKACRSLCAETIGRCVADGFRYRFCKRTYVKVCRKQGARACSPLTTTTSSTTSSTLGQIEHATTTTSIRNTATTSTLAPQNRQATLSVLAWATYQPGGAYLECADTIAIAVEVTADGVPGGLPLADRPPGFLGDPVWELHGGLGFNDCRTRQIEPPAAIKEDFCETIFPFVSVDPSICLPCNQVAAVPQTGSRRCTLFFHDLGPGQLEYTARPGFACRDLVTFGCTNVSCVPLPATREFPCE